MIPDLHTQTLGAALPGARTETALSLFSRGEAFDADGFASFFADAPVYQFGNAPVQTDRAGIARSSQAFFDGIQAVYHGIKAVWEVGDVAVVEMDVAYWRPDGSRVTLPCADVFRFDGPRIAELRIFMDAAPVFDPSLDVAADASVYTVADGAAARSPGLMRRFYAEHPEGRRRVADGFPPRWSVAGPRWPVTP